MNDSEPKSLAINSSTRVMTDLRSARCCNSRMVLAHNLLHSQDVFYDIRHKAADLGRTMDSAIARHQE